MIRRPDRLTPTLRSALDAASPGPLRHRLRQAVPVIAQCSVTAGAAWWIAGSIFGHQAPVFAASAAVVCLAAGVGGRGRQAVDLLAGVLAGVAVGELFRLVGIGTGPWQTVLAVALAMVAAAIIDARPLAYIQSGAAVLFVLTLAPAGRSLGHLLDAAVGGALGLLGSQVLFSPDPLKLVAAPVREILHATADALRTAAEALGRNSSHLAATACDRARDAHARLGGLARARLTARRVTARTVRGHRRAARVRQVDDRLSDIDVLVAAALLLCENVRERIRTGEENAPDRLPDQLLGLAAGLDELAGRHLPAVGEVTADGVGPRGPARPAVGPRSGLERAGFDVHLHDATGALDRLRSATTAD
ncbi:FUSC family protein [Micromonospora inositola]|uniref:Fusaric acid resistance protein-like n=1 Tax=Micromonospora inositola TaxID=47865 RepID=A0A1C5H3P3_9ACTN|nr:FUSC family protein [Micromonospora inositola]SCG40507.1 Fusaric acid resistance protein-like [Micromonospora inositola]